jgi:hypothetical protein
MILTPENAPNHPVVGRMFRAYVSKVYYCDSYDPSCGYWMTNVDDPTDRTNVSERAIGRTFHEVSR